MKRRLLAILLLFSLVAGAVIWFAGPAVPSHQGKDVYQWMLETKSSALGDNPGLTAIGSNAVPFIAEMLVLEQTRFDRHAWVRKPPFQKLARRLHLGRTWTTSARELNRGAGWSLLAFSFEAKPALPQIHAVLVRTNSPHRQMLANTISAMGCPPESIPWLVRAWPLATNESSSVRGDMLHLIGRSGPEAARLATPLTVDALNDRDQRVRSGAAQALARWGWPAPQAVPSLLTLLNSTNDYLAMSAASALGRITNRCDAAIPGLHRLLDSTTNDYTRAVATMTLWRLGGDVEEARARLEPLLSSKSGKGIAARSLGEMGPLARASVPALLKASQESIGTWVEMSDRAHCAKAALRIQGETAEAYAVLEEAITTEKNSWARGTMCDEIAQLTNLARPLLPALRQALNDPDRDVRYEAAQALQKLNQPAPAR